MKAILKTGVAQNKKGFRCFEENTGPVMAYGLPLGQTFWFYPFLCRNRKSFQVREPADISQDFASVCPAVQAENRYWH